MECVSKLAVLGVRAQRDFIQKITAIHVNCTLAEVKTIILINDLQQSSSQECQMI